jgi:hypothetical protein
MGEERLLPPQEAARCRKQISPSADAYKRRR